MLSNPPSRAPQNYVCPICVGLKGGPSDATLIKPSDTVYADDLVTVLINSFFVEGNDGHAIIVPNEHYENLYTLPPAVGHRVFEVAQKVALAMKQAYACDGITLRQNNEPAADQHAFHFHLHVFPRYDGDNYNGALPANKKLADPTVRAEFAQKLAAALQS